MLAVRAIAAGCVDEYEAWTASSFASYLRARTRYYSLEARWPDAPFWRMRRPRSSLPETIEL
jgi:hypothetical protein